MKAISAVGYLFWGYIVSPLLKSRRGKLDREEGATFLAAHERSTVLRGRFERKYAALKTRHVGPSTLLRAFIELHAGQLSVQFLVACMDLAARLMTAFLLREFISWRKGKGHHETEAWGLIVAALITLSSVLQAFCFQHAWQCGLNAMLGARAQLITALQNKVLRVTKAAVHRIGIGDMVDVISNDVRRLEEALPMWTYLILGPLGMFLATLMIALEVGLFPALAGSGILLLAIPTQALFLRHHIHVRTDLSKASAKRVQLVHEIVHGATSVKVSGLEDPYHERALRIRDHEHHLMAERSIVRAVSFTVMICTVPVASAAIFLIAFKLGFTLTLASVFYTVTLLLVIRDHMAVYFVRALEALAELHVCFSRVDRFLRSSDAPPPGQRVAAAAKTHLDVSTSGAKSGDSSDAPMVEIRGTFQWDLKGSSQAAIKKALSRALTKHRQVSVKAKPLLALDVATDARKEPGKDRGGAWHRGARVTPEPPRMPIPAPVVAVAVAPQASVTDVSTSSTESTASPRTATCTNGRPGDPADAQGHVPGTATASAYAEDLLAKPSAAAPAPRTKIRFASVSSSSAGDDAPIPNLPDRKSGSASVKSFAAPRSRGRSLSIGNRNGSSRGMNRSRSRAGTHFKSFRWDVDENSFAADKTVLATLQQPALRGIDLSFQRGALVGIVGSVGSGKSALLSTLVHEILPSKSHAADSYVHVGGSIAFVSQSMWLMPGSIRDNVTFGRPWDEAKFHAVMRACCMSDDLNRLPARELTDVGDLGRALSAGQKAQLTLARAAYSEADVVVIDNVFAALDADTIHTIFSSCIAKLMRHATRIIAVSDLALFKHFERLVVLREGEVIAEGPLDVLTARGIPEVIHPSDDIEEDALYASDEDDFVDDEPSAKEGTAVKALFGRAARTSGPAGEPNVTRTSVSGFHESKAGHPEDDDQSTRLRERERTPSPVLFERGAKIGAGGQLQATDSKRDLLAMVGRSSLKSMAGRIPRESNNSTSSSVQEDLINGQSRRVSNPLGLGSSSGGIGLAAALNTSSGRNAASSRWIKMVKTTAARNVLAVAVRHEKKKRERTLKVEDEQEEVDQVLAARAHLPNLDDQEHAINVWRAMLTYLQHMGPFHFALATLLLVVGQAAEMAQHVWLSRWAKTYGEKQERTMYPIVLGSLTGLLLVVTIVRTLHYFAQSDLASTRICNLFVWKLLRSPLSFFHSTPSSLILNRASRDQSHVDDLYPAILFDLLSMILVVIGSLIYATWALWYTILMAIPLFGTFLVLQRYYTGLARETHRLETVTISPLISSFASSISGLTFIRAYGFEAQVLQAMDRAMDLNSGWFKLSRASARWLGLWVDLLASALLCFFTFVTAAQMSGRLSGSGAASGSAKKSYTAAKDAALTALALSQIVSLSDALRWLTKLLVELETVSVSSQRVIDYTRLPEDHKRAADDAGLAPPPHWPRTGLVRFRDVVARYRPGLAPALKNVTFTVAPGLTTAFAGATGSGKSSVLLALMRTIEVSHGGIFFDGLDISRLGIDALRDRIAVIPQEPLIFSSSIRNNLDPWGRAEDAQIWRVAESVKLKGLITSAGGLDAFLNAEVGVLSLGQRLSICLARVLLRKAYCLCMDEACSGVDPETDRVMKAALRDAACELDDRSHEAMRSVLVIAHHVDTLRSCDTLVVLDAGRVVEQGTPEELEHKPGSHFARLVATHTQRRVDEHSAA